MSSRTIFDDLVSAVLSYEPERCKDATKKALKLRVSPVDILEKGLAKGLRIIGEKFEKGQLYLPELVAAADAVQKVMNDVLRSEFLKDGRERKAAGKVVIGTVEGDIHDIGKNIVAAMLFVAGFEVHDLGKNVPVERFVEKTKEVDADIVAASALMTTTLYIQQDIVKALFAAGFREKVKIMVGGASVTKKWAEKIGADAYAGNAIEAVRLAKKLLYIE